MEITIQKITGFILDIQFKENVRKVSLEKIELINVVNNQYNFKGNFVYDIDRPNLFISVEFSISEIETGKAFAPSILGSGKITLSDYSYKKIEEHYEMDKFR